MPKCSNGEAVLNEERNRCFLQTKIENCDIQINDKCSECSKGYKPSKDQKSCEICESGKDEDIISCLYVEYCKYHYSVFNKYKKPMVECISCNSNDYYLTTSRQQCNDCGKGKYKLNGQCIDEIKNCVKYKSEQECEQCTFEYQIKNGKCLPCVKPYTGSDGKTCHLTHFRCGHDDDLGNCAECTEFFSLSSEKTCVREGIEDKDQGTSNSFSLNLNLNIILLIFYGLLI